MNWLKRLFGRGRPPVPPPPLADSALHVLETRVPFYARLPAEQQSALRGLVARFLAEKQFWGSAGLTVTEEMKVLVAAFACLILLGRPDLGLFPRTREVILYPDEFGEVTEAIAPDGRRIPIADLRLGEAWHRGPVLLSWESVRALTAGARERVNVVVHEFAHTLDFLDGLADGRAPTGDLDHVEFVMALEDEYEAFVREVERGRATLLDEYAAEDPAEFFAVASECFFQQPRSLRQRHPNLYRHLAAFYRQDPANWEARRD